MARRFQLTETADRDITAVLRDTARLFGPSQMTRYAALLEQAMQLVADEPQHLASRARSDLADDLRSFHIEHAARRRGAGAHVIYYLPGGDGVIVLRVLHEAMDPHRHLAGGLTDDQLM